MIQTTTLMRTHRRPGETRLADANLGGDGATTLEALEYLQPSALVNRCDDLDAFVASLPRPHAGRSLAESVAQVLEAVCGRLKYEKKVTTARTPLSEALALGRGVCQDFAHLFLGACRCIGLPARYVSGYLCGPGELATHAWCQVWGGRIGWVDVDPTRGNFADDNYVVTAVGRDFLDVPPNRGVWKGLADEVITVAVKVEPTERMPPDWAEWNAQASWASTPWPHSQRYDRRHNPFSKSLYRQQQSQQQQS
jgi:transglutaminase-like putative cysteine protease